MLWRCFLTVLAAGSVPTTFNPSAISLFKPTVTLALLGHIIRHSKLDFGWALGSNGAGTKPAHFATPFRSRKSFTFSTYPTSPRLLPYATIMNAQFPS